MSSLVPDTTPSTGQNEPISSALTSTSPSLDIIYHNMWADSNFRTFRTSGATSIEMAVLAVAKHLQDGCYNIISISGSKYSLVVVLSTKLSFEELNAKGFPFPLSESREDSPKALAFG
jgi:hypothetical protein